MSRSSLVFQSISALHQEAESAHLKLVHSDKNMKEVLEPFDDEELDEAASVMGADEARAPDLQKAIIQTQKPLPKLPNSSDIFARIESLAGAGNETARQAEKEAAILAHLDDMLKDAEASLLDTTPETDMNPALDATAAYNNQTAALDMQPSLEAPSQTLSADENQPEEITKTMADIRRSVEANVEVQPDTTSQPNQTPHQKHGQGSETAQMPAGAQLGARIAEDPQWQGMVRAMVRDVLAEELPDTIQKMVKDALRDITREGTSLPRQGGKMRTSRFRR